MASANYPSYIPSLTTMHSVGRNKNQWPWLIAVCLTSEAAPCSLQPCYFDKWDLFADTWDCQYAMGFPLCIFKYLGESLHNFLPIFPIS